jgi:hypothetical protein
MRSGAAAGALPWRCQHCHREGGASPSTNPEAVCAVFRDLACPSSMMKNLLWPRQHILVRVRLVGKDLSTSEAGGRESFLFRHCGNWEIMALITVCAASGSVVARAKNIPI